MKKTIQYLETKSVKNIQAIKGGRNVPQVIILLTDGSANAPTNP